MKLRYCLLSVCNSIVFLNICSVAYSLRSPPIQSFSTSFVSTHAGYIALNTEAVSTDAAIADYNPNRHLDKSKVEDLEQQLETMQRQCEIMQKTILDAKAEVALKPEQQERKAIALGQWHGQLESQTLHLDTAVGNRTNAPPIYAPRDARLPDLTKKSSERGHLPGAEAAEEATEEADEALYAFARRTPFYLMFIGLFVACFLLMMDYMFQLDEERTCFNRLHEWEEGTGHSAGSAQIMDYIGLDPGGGLDKLSLVMPPPGHIDWGRLLGALSVVVFALYNVIFIFDGDIRALINCAKFQMTESTRGLSDQFKDLLGATGASPIITDPRTLMFVACAEVIGLTVLIVQGLVDLAVFFVHIRSKDYHYNSFYSLWQFADSLRLLCTYSMLKLLWLIHPTLVSRELSAFYVVITEHADLKHSGFTKKLYIGVRMAMKVAWKLVLVCVLFVAFGVKVAIVSTWIHYPNHDDVHTKYFGLISHASVKVWLAIGNFLMQALGAMQLDRVMLERVFVFVFGGTKATMNRQDEIMLRVYKARVAQVVYEDFWEAGRPVSFFSLILTLNDVDLQWMLVKEDSKRKLERMTTMDQTIEVDAHGHTPRD